MLPRLRELVRKETTYEQWNLHVAIVVDYAKKLAITEKVDPDLVEIAALLHDIGRFRHGGKDHEITGIAEAEKILKDLGASHDVIKEVTHCVATHRGKSDNPPRTKIAQIVRDADALSHFDVVPWLIRFELSENGDNLKEALLWAENKLSRDWAKISLPVSKKLGKDKYGAAMLIVKANLALFQKE
jgi:putative nucleotidyltransferase with HDIG domain